MLLNLFLLISGLGLLVWSADRFVDGSSGLAGHFGISPLLIGIVIVGFGTSAPEMLVSVLSAIQGNSGLSLGNAYGSNICNIALILGLTALIRPISVQSGILKKELPILTAATLFSFFLAQDHYLSRLDAIFLIAGFAATLSWSLLSDKAGKSDTLAMEMSRSLENRTATTRQYIFRMITGLILLLASSRILVYAGVEIARQMGVSDLFIGLTIVAVGTSLPELASSVAAARRGENDIVMGNIIGSNLFNTLAVVGLSASIRPFSIAPEMLWRDMGLMLFLTLLIFVLGYGFFKKPGRINRLEGGLLLSLYILYIGALVYGT